jgi:DNA primase
VLNLLKPGEPLFITEGCSDCWAMLSSGHKAIAIPSATLLKPKDVELLSTLNSKISISFHMYPDRDEPGERLFMQLKQVLPSLVHHQLPPDCKDFSDLYLKKTPL